MPQTGPAARYSVKNTQSVPVERYSVKNTHRHPNLNNKKHRVVLNTECCKTKEGNYLQTIIYNILADLSDETL